MPGTVVVCGVSGNVGRRLAARLAGAGTPVRGVLLHPGHAPSMDGLEVVTADLTDPVMARRAVRGADAVYLTPPEKGPDPLLVERLVARTVCGAVADEDVEHLVAHTALHADRFHTGVQMLENKRFVEEEVRASGVPWTLLRPGVFLDTLFGAGPTVQTNALHVPLAPHRRFGAVCADDVARAAASLFLTGRPRMEAYDLHLPGGVSGEDLRGMAAELLDRPFHLQRQSLQEYAAGLGMPLAERRLYVDLFGYIAQFDYVGEPETIREAVPGFRYTSVERFLQSEVLPRFGALAPEPREQGAAG